MRPARSSLALGFILVCLLSTASKARSFFTNQTSSASASRPAQQAPPSTTSRVVIGYSLPPERYKLAHDLGTSFFIYQLVVFAYAVIVLLLMLRLRLALTLRRWAANVIKNQAAQALIFTPLLILVLTLLLLPTDIYRHSLSLKYGLSIQGWASWLWDWSKFQSILLLLSSFMGWLLYAIIRRSPRRWWLYFWLASLPIGLGLVFLQPLIFDPLFHRFEPLANKDQSLAIELQKMVGRAGENIPADRMFWMEAGNKTTTLNAYVTGFGASKRIVVWDTTIAGMTTPQIVFVAGHEMGHYTLQHIPKGLLAGAGILLVAFFLGSHCAQWLVQRLGEQWGISSLADLSSLPVLLLLVVTFSFVMSPIANALSRHYEHQADQYALEVTHDLIPNSGQIGAQAFQVLGDIDLSDPAPNPIDVFMFYDHPPISDRVKFSLSYNPWARGESPEFVR